MPDKSPLIQEMLIALQKPRKPLTKWEANFIESIADQFDRTGSLSTRQLEVLDKIYGDKT